MKIFLPFKKDLNPYLEEIEKHSHCEFVYSHFENYDSSFKIVNIHWPEAIFDWYEPTTDQLETLESAIKEWKVNSTIIYTKHDDERHKGMTPNFRRLFKLIEENSDIFIHLGQYSKRKYEKIYPTARHSVVYHPLYSHFFKIYPKEYARKILEIDKNSLVIIAPGTIRNIKEREMVLKSFKKFKSRNKVLIATKMRNEIEFDFPGRTRLKSIFDVRNFIVNRFKNNHTPPKYLFSYRKISFEKFSLLMSAGDIVLIPRIKTLNSGNVLLGFTFNKVVVAAETGNLTEQLKEIGLPTFNPFSINSIVEAIGEGEKLFKTGFNLPKEEMKKYQPKEVAKAMDEIFYK